jgi:hypothetical protein
MREDGRNRRRSGPSLTAVQPVCPLASSGSGLVSIGQVCP